MADINGLPVSNVHIYIYYVVAIKREKGLTRKEALAAVTVPCGLTKAGLSLAICLGVDTLMPLSLLTTVTPLPPARTITRHSKYT